MSLVIIIKYDNEKTLGMVKAWDLNMGKYKFGPCRWSTINLTKDLAFVLSSPTLHSTRTTIAVVVASQ